MRKIKLALRAVRIIKNWPLYFAAYFGLISKEYIILTLRSDVKFKIRAQTNDRVLFNDVWLSDSYFPPGFEIQEGDSVMDIGAHIGFFSVYAAERAKKGNVSSFEPAPANFELLQENIALNNIPNISAQNKAIAGENGAREFIVYQGSTGAHSFVYGPSVEQKIKVEALILDYAAKDLDRIDFLKLDCEVAEYEILFSASSSTLGKIQKISMEFHEMDEERNASKLKEFLEKNGFKVRIDARYGSMLYARRQ